MQWWFLFSLNFRVQYNFAARLPTGIKSPGLSIKSMMKFGLISLALWEIFDPWFFIDVSVVSFAEIEFFNDLAEFSFIFKDFDLLSYEMSDESFICKKFSRSNDAK